MMDDIQYGILQLGDVIKLNERHKFSWVSSGVEELIDVDYYPLFATLYRVEKLVPEYLDDDVIDYNVFCTKVDQPEFKIMISYRDFIKSAKSDRPIGVNLMF